jgi:hypothetical protein
MHPKTWRNDAFMFGVGIMFGADGMHAQSRSFFISFSFPDHLGFRIAFSQSSNIVKFWQPIIFKTGKKPKQLTVL